MERISFNFIFILLMFIILSSCNAPQQNINPQNQITYNIKSNKSITGKVEFPSVSSLSSFSTKATLLDIAVGATVSLIYPSDHATKANVTIATGLTNSSGQFTINPDSSFQALSGDVFVLEAIKRLGGAGNNSIALRTNIQWNGSTWDSITIPNIFINTKTTALSIISSLNPLTLPASGTIKKMSIVSGVAQVVTINSTFTANLINTIKWAVEQALTNNIDPVATITLSNNQYFFQGNPILPINVIYVNTNAIGSNNGTSWTNAYISLQDALTAATSDKDIWVATGTYKPGTLVTDTFQLKNGVAIYGGFAGTEINLSQRNFDTNVVILSGDLNSSNSANAGDSYHVVKGATGAILDGVTVKFGNASTGTFPDHSGGGMYNDNSSPTLTNVIFSNNSSSYGGGMLNINSSSPTLTNVTFSNNYSFWGGGLYNKLSSPTLTNVTFSNNSVSSGGGGIFNLSSSSPTLTNVTFLNNSAVNGGGGGMYNDNSSPTLTNVIFSSNTTYYKGGGGMHNYGSKSTLTNVIFFSNRSSFSGGGGLYNDNSSPILTNVTFYDNRANKGYPGGGMYNDNSSGCLPLSSPIVKNSIFWGNVANVGKDIYNYYDSTLNIGYSALEGNFIGITGGGIIKDMTGTTTLNTSNYLSVGHITNQNPFFLNVLDLDGADNILGTSDDGLTLQSGSSARNTGTAIGAPITDIVGVTRSKGAGVDMGAYEYFE